MLNKYTPQLKFVLPNFETFFKKPYYLDYPTLKNKDDTTVIIKMIQLL